MRESHYHKISGLDAENVVVALQFWDSNIQKAHCKNNFKLFNHLWIKKKKKNHRKYTTE